MKAYFSLPQCCQFLAHGCQNWDIDLKFEIGGRIDTILLCVKFGDDSKSFLDFSFMGGCTLNLIGVGTTQQMKRVRTKDIAKYCQAVNNTNSHKTVFSKNNHQINDITILNLNPKSY